MKDYRGSRKLSFEEVVERLGGSLGNSILSSSAPVRRRSTVLDGKVGSLKARVRGNVRDICTYTRRKPRKCSRNSAETDVDDRG